MIRLFSSCHRIMFSNNHKKLRTPKKRSSSLYVTTEEAFDTSIYLAANVSSVTQRSQSVPVLFQGKHWAEHEMHKVGGTETIIGSSVTRKSATWWRDRRKLRQQRWTEFSKSVTISHTDHTISKMLCSMGVLQISWSVIKKQRRIRI
jgi:hypothetical protein